MTLWLIHGAEGHGFCRFGSQVFHELWVTDLAWVCGREKRARASTFVHVPRNRRQMNLYLRYNERRKFKISCCCDGLSALKLLITPLASELHFERCKRS